MSGPQRPQRSGEPATIIAPPRPPAARAAKGGRPGWLVPLIAAVVAVACVAAGLLLWAPWKSSAPHVTGISNTATHHGITAVIASAHTSGNLVKQKLKITNTTSKPVSGVVLKITMVEHGATGLRIHVSQKLTFTSPIRAGATSTYTITYPLTQAGNTIDGWHVSILSP